MVSEIWYNSRGTLKTKEKRKKTTHGHKLIQLCQTFDVHICNAD